MKHLLIALSTLVFVGCSSATGPIPEPRITSEPTSRPASASQPTSRPAAEVPETVATETPTWERVEKSREEWREQLTAQQFKVTRQAGTERPFTGDYWDNKREGTYLCVCCELDLFESGTKYKSGTGWPSFWEPAAAANIAEHKDTKLMRPRVEVTCARCDAHLGHVFPDGPEPTGLRYCINSASLLFREE